MTTTNEPIESKFRMILLAAKRARQVQSGAKPLVHTTTRKATRVAVEEFRAGVLPYEILMSPVTEGSSKESVPAPKPKK
jgi:DNA-directed RNA polymerase subunit omega